MEYNDDYIIHDICTCILLYNYNVQQIYNVVK
jgi:hypothetical protein